MKMEKREIENILRNFFYTEVLKKIERSCKQTYNNIWGKEIIIVQGDEIVQKSEIETWLIHAKIDCEHVTLDGLQELCYDLAQKAAEYEKQQLGSNNAKNCSCHVLCDWRFVENEAGGIINNGKLSLVKYAKILEDIK